MSRSMNRRGGSSRVRGGDSSQDNLHGTNEKHFDDPKDESGFERQGANRRVAHKGAGDGSSGIVITTMGELSNAIQSKNMSLVTRISLDGQAIGRGQFGLAMALATCQMSALEELVVRGNLSEAVVKALSLGNFPSLRKIDLGQNVIGTGSIEALNRAIGSGKLEKLESLNLWNTDINDDAMATLAIAFQQGEASVVPNLRNLNLAKNSFTELGLQSMAESLKSGRLDSLESLSLKESPDPSQAGAEAIVSALDLNSCLAVDVEFEWHLFPELQRRQEQLRERNFGHKGSLMVPAAFGTIYLCGNPKAGTKTLCHTLQMTFWQSLWTSKRRPDVTRGIDVSKVSSKGSKRRKENPITLFVHDVAQHQISSLVQNALFPALRFSKENKVTISQGTATIFVIVCNSKNPQDEVEQQLDYWLRYIASGYHEATKQIGHVFVVLNTMGEEEEVQRNCEYWKDLLPKKSKEFNGSLDVHTNSFVLDVGRRGKVNGLKTCLLEHSRKLLKERKVPEICDRIRRSLPIWSETRKKFPVLHWEEFLHEVEKLSGKGREKIILSATEYLNEAGALVYIDKSFPSQLGILYRRLIILNPNWFWKELIGNIFLSEGTGNGRAVDHVLRNKVNPTTGSISMSDFKSFLKSKWSPEDCDDLIAILLWLRVCYTVKEKVCIPSLIDTNVDAGDPWQAQSASAREDGEEQWVMGFTIEHQSNAMTRAPMSLWGRFQVQLAQNPKFNNGNVPDNDFVADKYSMTFTVDYMYVRIEVDAEIESPTFDEIGIFVKPLFSKDEMDMIQRKQRQVDLADDLVNILLGLSKEIGVGVDFVVKVVWPWPVSEFWPWPVSQSRPVHNPDRNVELSKVKEWVLMHGMGRKMPWPVGSDSTITEDQLLSTNHKM